MNSPSSWNDYIGTRGGIKFYADPAKVNSLPVGVSYNDIYNPDGSKKNNNVDTAGINDYLNSLGKEPNRVYSYGANGEMYNYAGDLIYKPAQQNNTPTSTSSNSSKNTFINNQVSNNNASTKEPTYSNSYTPENGGFIRGNDGTYTYKAGTNTNNQTPTQSRSDIAFQNYINTLSLGDDERNALLGLTNLQNQAAQESEQARYSGETSGFAAGEQERVNRNNNLAINAATNRYNAFRDIADRKSNIAKLQYERELALEKSNSSTKKYEDQFTLGNSRYGINPATGEYEIIATAPKSSGGSSSSSGTKKESTAVSMGNDVIDALDFLQTQKESNNWKGINPDNYNYYRNQLIRTYGSSAATLFDKEFTNRGLEVDNKDYNKQNWFQRTF